MPVSGFHPVFMRKMSRGFFQKSWFHTLLRESLLIFSRLCSVLHCGPDAPLTGVWLGGSGGKRLGAVNRRGACETQAKSNFAVGSGPQVQHSWEKDFSPHNKPNQTKQTQKNSGESVPARDTTLWDIILPHHGLIISSCACLHVVSYSGCSLANWLRRSLPTGCLHGFTPPDSTTCLIVDT